MRRIDIIINPISGTASKNNIPALAGELFPADRFDVRIHVTIRGGQASLLAKEAVYFGADTVVAVGGDGTINEVASALIESRSTRAKLGIVPMGSGNGLARHAEIPMDVREALQVIRDGHSELIDYGDLNGHKFFTTAGTGFDAEVGQRFSQMGMRGPVSYGRAILEMAAIYHPREYTIYTDHEVFREKAFLITVGNAAQWGNRFYITPQASQQDGLFSVSVVQPFLMIEAPILTYQLLSRQFDRNQHVRTIESRHLRIESKDLGYCHVDGEPMQIEGPLDFTMHASALRIIVPFVRNNKL